MLNLNKLKREYQKGEIDIKSLSDNPFHQFKIWFEEAQKANNLEPNAMMLATATKKGKPSSRTVLLKGIDERGFIFYTNYESRKARELDENPYASATFYWPQLERQVILEGQIEKISTIESDKYFQARPRNSQISSWVSKQDQIIGSRDELEQEFKKIEKKFEGKPIPRPPFWGGYRILPKAMEFWQGRENRLHDRFRYIWEEANNAWSIVRLAP